MGVISSIFNRFFGKKEIRIVMVGLDNVGKTTILYKLKLGEIITSIPTIGFNVETLIHKNISFTVWDVGGGDKIRPLWYHYYHNMEHNGAVIFVVDSTDRERIQEAERDLKYLFYREELVNAVLLVFANKQDLPNAMTVDEITNKLLLNKLKHHRWYVQSTIAVQGHGLHEGLDWLANELAG